jgi:drug/metabolite transporter (DMT)-like permease
MLARSVRSAGIVRTDVAQRLSLFLSLAAAFLLFGEALLPLKVLGIVLALVAVACILWRNERVERAGWLAPLAVFAGFGAIDICFKLVAQAHAPFPSALLASFLIALVFCWIAVLIRALTRHAPLSPRSVGFGVILGAANFANILFYIRGHQALPNDPSLVFASMNLGVVLLGALVGAIGFREKLSWLNWVGLGVAVAAIGVMAVA